MRHNPYAVWVSEIMLQQTQVRTVEPYFVRWMERFPDIAALASAGADEVLRHWEGLGYYGRARRLHQAARVVLERHGGALPEDVRLLRALPGIGDYTAAAIAAIAFNRRQVALDANARRVLQRIHTVHASDRVLADLARPMIPEGRAGDFAQALFELGASLCTAERTRCHECPIETECLARRSGEPMAYGGPSAKPSIIHLTRVVSVVIHGGEALVVRRQPRGIWAGLWEFPWTNAGDGEDVLLAARRAALDAAGVAATMTVVLGALRHSVTRYRIELHAVVGWAARRDSVPRTCAETAWLTWDEMDALPMPSPQRRLVAMARERISEAEPGRLEEGYRYLANDGAQMLTGERA